MLNRWFGKKQDGGPPASAPDLRELRVPRHSGGWAALRKRLETESDLHTIDTGSTSSTNISYLTGLGHSVFLANLVHDALTGEWQTGLDGAGNPTWNVEGFLEESLNFSGRRFDVVLLWTALDYLPEALVEPVVEHLFEAMNPEGQLLAFFHTRSQGEETAYCRFHVTPTDDVEVQLAEPFPMQRTFSNRSIQQLFKDWSGFRQFLAKDSVSEVIITR